MRWEDCRQTKSAQASSGLADFPSGELATDSAVFFAVAHIVHTHYLEVNISGFSTWQEDEIL